MIRQLVIIAVAAVCLILSTTATPVTDETEIEKAQKLLYTLAFNNFDLNKLDSEFRDKAINYDLQAEIDGFEAEYQAIVTKFLQLYKSGSLLPRSSLFSIYYPELKEETILMFNLFYHAPITSLPYITAWAHSRLNYYQFNYVFTVIMIHRSDTYFIPMPRPYRQVPEFYFNSDVMKQVYDYKMSLANSGLKGEDQHTHAVMANYTSWYITSCDDHEYHLNYFMEDIDLNVWYFYYNARFPSWLSRESCPNLPIERGENFYYIHKMLLNRYLAERLSFGLDKLELLDWEKPVITGYCPRMSFANGLHFPCREPKAQIPICKKKYVEEIRERESRLSNVADSGYFMTKDGKFESIHTKDGFNSFCNLVQGNNDSLNWNFYGSLDTQYRNIYGFSPEPHNHRQILPSALEIIATTLRDPGAYRYFYKIMSFFEKYKKTLGPYPKHELAFDGVTIKSANIVGNKVYTYKEPIDVLIDKFTYSDGKKMTKIKARQYRLNHELFTYNMGINSQHNVKASVRVFIGPKYDADGKEFRFKTENFYQLDYFTFDLTEGENTIIRNSTETTWCAPTHAESETFENFAEGPERLAFTHRRFAFPCHLLVPRGKEEGMPFEILTHVSKCEPDSRDGLEYSPEIRDDKYPGYPLDRPIYDYNMTNMYFSDVKIYYKPEGY